MLSRREVLEYRALLKEAKKNNKKYATFLAILLIEEASLKDYDPVTVCKILGMPESYEWQVKNVLRVGDVLTDFGYQLIKED